MPRIKRRRSPIKPNPTHERTPRATETLAIIQTALEDSKAEEIITLDLHNKSNIADYMIIASGRADRHVSAIADRILEALKHAGLSDIHVEGQEQGHWVLIDTLDILIHLFRPDVREYYNLEKMWSAPLTKE